MRVIRPCERKMTSNQSNPWGEPMQKPPGHEERLLAIEDRVQAELAALEPSRTGGRRTPLTAAKKAEIRRLRKGGKSFEQIARMAGVSKKAAYKHGKES